MLLGLPLTLIALAQVASPSPAQASPPAASGDPAPTPAADGCRTTAPPTNSRTIVVCAQKPQGYRLDPDVMEARKEARNRTGGPKPRETMKDNPCSTVGPMGCRGNPGIDIVSAAAVLGQMAAKASRGENVGQMFETEPQPSEYQLYMAAKKRREAKEADAAAKAARTKAAAAQAAHGGSVANGAQSPAF